MNLFWETRQLTQAREDHLTCFIAAAHEVDDAFCRAYESVVLTPLAHGASIPRIAKIHTQVSYVAEHSRPDMLLVLEDGRRVACEHKIDATETAYVARDGEAMKQLERYLELPDVSAVCYFRPALVTLADSVIAHERYLRPEASPHFLWRDLFVPLTLGTGDLAQWLHQGFERLGYTPPVPHVGELWPDDRVEVKENQANFGKLWHTTHSHLALRGKVTTGRRCELYLQPPCEGPITRVYISPLAQAGSLLRLRLVINEAAEPEIHERIDALASALPVSPEVVRGKLANGRAFIDLLAPLHLVMGTAADAAQQAARLFQQTMPVLDGLLINRRIERRGLRG